MKTIACLLLVIFLNFSLFSLQAKEKTKTQETMPSPATTQSIPFAEVAKSTAEVLCKRTDECSKEKLPAGECLKETQEAFTQAYDRLPKNKKVEVTQDENVNCIKTIEKMHCQELQSASKLPGCEYIEKLNQP
ncbi:MAG: hypothetical protein HQM15_07270 [Deltaproteobacteria bacterium]|nr:hypothetical protein [Deltaproteobacteria bacterium]